MLKYLLYIVRWVVLAVPGAIFFTGVKKLLGIQDVYLAMMISQALMGAMVYFIDRLIFGSGKVPIPWNIKRRAVCTECGRIGTCYRVDGSRCCDMGSGASHFRCGDCAIKKAQ